MPRSPRISISLDNDTYDQTVLKCAHDHEDISAYGRRLIIEDLKGKITEQNIDLISSIVREQVDAVMQPYLERLIKLTSMTCIQAGTSAYLSAEALSNFVSDNKQRDFADAYTQARKKSVAYLKSHEF